MVSDDLIQRAKAGDPASMLNLALAYDAGGQFEDAASWMDKAAATDDPTSRLQSALWVLYGANVTRDPVAAFDSIKNLGQDGDSRAQRLTAVLLAFGLGCQRDWGAALACLKQLSTPGTMQHAPKWPCLMTWYTTLRVGVRPDLNCFCPTQELKFIAI